MPVRNQNWYNLQSTRRYPLDDKSTGMDDSGALIRDDIIVDCHIKFPAAYGNYLYVQGLTVTENLITVVFGAAASLDDMTGPTVAAISVPKPADPNRNYTIQAIQSGVSGWVTFGPGIDTPFIGRYAAPKQTFIGLRNARPYDPLPIPTLAKHNVDTGLAGLVRITAANPIVAQYIDEYTLPENQRLPKYNPDTQETNTSPIRAILFSTITPTTGFNPLFEFLGQCGQRPESGTCPKKPIEHINGIGPDCETGNINILIAPDSGLTMRMFAECGGADITTPRGLAEACQKDPKSEKKRKDECCDGPDALDEYCWPPFDQPDSIVCSADDGAPCPALPICTSFSPCHSNLFEVISGSFNVRTSVAPPVCCPAELGLTNHEVYAAASPAAINIALYKGCASDWAYNHTISVDVRPRTGGVGQNGGVIANYMRVTEDGRCKTKYVAATVDIGTNELQIYRFDGNTLIAEGTLAVSVDTSSWYKLSINAAAVGGTTAVTATLYNITTAQQVATLTTTMADYEVVDGRAGLFTNGSLAYFNRFEVV